MKYPRICILDGGINKIKPTGLLTVPSPQIWRTKTVTVKRTEWYQPPTAHLFTASPLWDRARLPDCCIFIKFCHETFFLNLITHMFNHPGNKLDCTCIAERISLTVKSDHVFLPQCNTKPEEFSWQGRFSIIKKSQLHWKSCLSLHWTDSPNKGII